MTNAPIPTSSGLGTTPMPTASSFSTRDLGLAATLIYLKFDMHNVDYQIEGNKNYLVGYFQFLDTPELQEAKVQYYSAKLAVEPNAYNNIIRRLKAEINNVYKDPHTLDMN